MMQSTDLAAKLLATENLTVVRANARTASFDIKSRVLTLPMWKDMTPEIEDMLVGHEVGHALYTGDAYIEPIKENRKMMSYLNVLEDVRIEKLIKREYPGLRKRMNEGYKQLNERDFFGVSKVPLDSLILIDKLNLYFKAGYQCGVTFSMEEKLFVARAGQTETIEDVIQLAQDVYTFSKEQAEKRKQQAQEENPDDSEEEETEDDFGDDEMDSYDDDSIEYEDADTTPVPAKQRSEFDEDEDKTAGRRSRAIDYTKDPVKAEEDELESKTDKAFADKLEDLADTSTQYNYYNFSNIPELDPVIGYKKVIAETNIDAYFEERELASYHTRRLGEDFHEKLQEEFVKFKADSQSTVNYLVKEFEMRKSAKMYKRATTSKIGSLDMKKVWSYKLNDDLFKRVTAIPQGKNHGMLFLLDWSGSMDNVMEDTLKQVINLAMFCNKAQIPYRVLAFTTQYTREDRQDRYQILRVRSRDWVDTNANIIDCTREFDLLELLSSKMSMSEFNTMSKRLLDKRFQWMDKYQMGGTPLNEALVWVYNNLGTYMRSNNIEKMSLITLTDGCGANLTPIMGSFRDYGTAYDDAGVRTALKIKHFVRDDVTKKTYEFTRESTQQTEQILKMIKDRYAVKVVGFYICRNNRRDLHSALRDNLHGFNGNAYAMIEGWRSQFKKNGFASVAGTGRDDLFIVPMSSTKIQEGELKADGDMKAAALARNFTKFLNVKKTSRVLLNTFVGYVA